MYFSVSATQLLTTLAIVKKAVKNNPGLPILENVLFEVKGQTLIMTASDLQTSIITTLGVKEAEEGRIAVPARMLFSTLSFLPDKETLTFKFNSSTYSLTITSSKGEYKLSCESAEDFPQVSKPDQPYGRIEASADLFRKAFEQTMFAASQNESRPELDGVNIMMTTQGAVFSAIGDNQLARYKHSGISLQKALAQSGHRSNAVNDDQSTNFTIPSRSLQLLIQLFALPGIDLQKAVEVVFDDNKVCFSQETTHIIARLIENEFKPYESMLPSSTPQGLLTLHKETFLQSLKMMEVYANKTYRRIKMILDEVDRFEISALDQNFANEAREVHECVYKGTKIQIGFDVRLLSIMVSKIPSTHLVLRLYSADKPVCIVPADLDAEEDLLFLLAPMLLTQPEF